MPIEKPLFITAENETTIHYRFKDSSVPPNYHRSYKITIRLDVLSIVVDTYGKVLADEKIALKAEEFIFLIETINQSVLISGEVKAAKGCVGGTSERLGIFTKGESVYNGYFQNCGGTDIPKSFGDPKAVINVIKKMKPTISSLVKKKIDD